MGLGMKKQRSSIAVAAHSNKKDFSQVSAKQKVMGFSILLLLAALFIPSMAYASGTNHDFTSSTIGIVAVIIFVVAYALVIGEEALHLRKSKPVIIAAGLIWALVAVAYIGIGDNHSAEAAFRHGILEFGELFYSCWRQ